MLCHPYVDRVDCHVGGKPHTIKPPLTTSPNRITYLLALHEELVAFFEKNNVNHVAIEYANLGMGKKNVNRHTGEITGALVGAALHVGASVEKA